MRPKNTLFTIAILFLLIFFKNTAIAQVEAWDEQRRGSFYLGAGKSLVSTYGNSTIHINQGSRDDYQINDLKGSNTGSPTPPFSPLQLNYRLGYFFTYNQSWAIELNFDAATYYVKDSQSVSQSGAIKASGMLVFSAANGYKYALNGADQLLINIVKRKGLFWDKTHKVRIDILGKVGAGPMIPKANITLNNEPNNPQIQTAGWNAAAEIAGRVTLFRFLYFELSGKYDYASLSGIKIYHGTAAQNLTTTSVTASVGFTLPTTRHHPLFQKGEKEHRIITLKSMYPSDTN